METSPREDMLPLEEDEPDESEKLEGQSE